MHHTELIIAYSINSTTHHAHHQIFSSLAELLPHQVLTNQQLEFGLLHMVEDVLIG